MRRTRQAKRRRAVELARTVLASDVAPVVIGFCGSAASAARLRLALGRDGAGVMEVVRGVLNEVLLGRGGCSTRGVAAATRWSDAFAAASARQRRVAQFLVRNLCGHGAADVEPGWVEAQESLGLVSLPVVPPAVSERPLLSDDAGSRKRRSTSSLDDVFFEEEECSPSSSASAARTRGRRRVVVDGARRRCIGGAPSRPKQRREDERQREQARPAKASERRVVFAVSTSNRNLCSAACWCTGKITHAVSWLPGKALVPLLGLSATYGVGDEVPSIWACKAAAADRVAAALNVRPEDLGIAVKILFLVASDDGARRWRLVEALHHATRHLAGLSPVPQNDDDESLASADSQVFFDEDLFTDCDEEDDDEEASPSDLAVLDFPDVAGAKTSSKTAFLRSWNDGGTSPRRLLDHAAPFLQASLPLARHADLARLTAALANWPSHLHLQDGIRAVSVHRRSALTVFHSFGPYTSSSSSSSSRDDDDD